MARFDVYRYNSTRAPLIIDVQANLLSDLSSRVVVPLIPEKEGAHEILPRLKPLIEIEGHSYVLSTTDIGVIPLKAFGEFVENVEKDHHQTITEALDFLFQGF